MFDVAKTKQRVRKWALSHNSPTRKAAQKEFPGVPVKLLRQVLQSVRDHVSSSQESRDGLE